MGAYRRMHNSRNSRPLSEQSQKAYIFPADTWFVIHMPTYWYIVNVAALAIRFAARKVWNAWGPREGLYAAMFD